jgi:hypothetical protein
VTLNKRPLILKRSGGYAPRPRVYRVDGKPTTVADVAKRCNCTHQEAKAAMEYLTKQQHDWTQIQARITRKRHLIGAQKS